MTISNLMLHRDLTFEQYQQLEGLSHSMIKSGPVKQTEKMRFGTQVHDYLTYPRSFQGDIRIIKPIAQCIKYTIGDLWEHLQHQVAITCVMEHLGLQLKYKGLPDSCIPKKLVIDYKIGQNIRKSMEWFRYNNQINGYAIPLNAPIQLIIAVDPTAHKPVADVIPVQPSKEYWESVVLLRGEIIEPINYSS